MVHINVSSIMGILAGTNVSSIMGILAGTNVSSIMGILAGTNRKGMSGKATSAFQVYLLGRPVTDGMD